MLAALMFAGEIDFGGKMGEGIDLFIAEFALGKMDLSFFFFPGF